MANSLEERTKNLVESFNSDLSITLTKSEIKQVVNLILENEDVSKSIPIVRIAKQYSVYSYKIQLVFGTAAALFVNGAIKEVFGNNKVILVSNKEELYWQHYLMAFEFGNYILDFLGSKKYEDNGYYNHIYRYSDFQEKSDAKIFAYEILLPEQAFLNHYELCAREGKSSKQIVTDLSRLYEVPGLIVSSRITQVIHE